MQCPYCPEGSESFPDEGSLGFHVIQKHPEKVMSPESWGDQMRRVQDKMLVWQTAAHLTSITIGSNGSECTIELGSSPKKTTLDTFKWFLNELYKG